MAHNLIRRARGKDFAASQAKSRRLGRRLPRKPTVQLIPSPDSPGHFPADLPNAHQSAMSGINPEAVKNANMKQKASACLSSENYDPRARLSPPGQFRYAVDLITTEAHVTRHSRPPSHSPRHAALSCARTPRLPAARQQLVNGQTIVSAQPRLRIEGPPTRIQRQGWRRRPGQQGKDSMIIRRQIYSPQRRPEPRQDAKGARFPAPRSRTRSLVLPRSVTSPSGWPIACSVKLPAIVRAIAMNW